MCISTYTGSLASRVKRKDTLALKLSSRPSAPDRQAPERQTRMEYTGLSWQSKEQWEAIRTQIGTALTRYWSVLMLPPTHTRTHTFINN